jgi:hypothetical protein
MAAISVLVFAPQKVLPSNHPDHADTLSAYDWAFLAESRKERFISLKKPFAVIFERTSTTSAPYEPSLRPPILKIHVATAKPSNLLARIDELLRAVPPASQAEDWLDLSLTALQKAGIVQRFSILKFHQFVLNTLQNQPARRMSSGTTEIDYLALLSSNAEVKKMLNPEPELDGNGTGGMRQICGFWLSTRPESKLTYRESRGWQRRDDPYGGLM